MDGTTSAGEAARPSEQLTPADRCVQRSAQLTRTRHAVPLAVDGNTETPSQIGVCCNDIARGISNPPALHKRQHLGSAGDESQRLPHRTPSQRAALAQIELGGQPVPDPELARLDPCDQFLSEDHVLRIRHRPGAVRTSPETGNARPSCTSKDRAGRRRRTCPPDRVGDLRKRDWELCLYKPASRQSRTHFSFPQAFRADRAGQPFDSPSPPTRGRPPPSVPGRISLRQCGITEPSGSLWTAVGPVRVRFCNGPNGGERRAVSTRRPGARPCRGPRNQLDQADAQFSPYRQRGRQPRTVEVAS